MQAADVIIAYERILAASGEMVKAAEESRWDELVEIEIARRKLILAVTAEPAAPLSDPTLQARMERLIRSVLAADQQVKTLTMAWMSEIQGMLGSMQAERKLAKAYNTF